LALSALEVGRGDEVIISSLTFVADVNEVTLAPPLGRALVHHVPLLYPVLNTFPFLRTYIFALIKKPQI